MARLGWSSNSSVHMELRGGLILLPRWDHGEKIVLERLMRRVDAASQVSKPSGSGAASSECGTSGGWHVRKKPASHQARRLRCRSLEASLDARVDRALAPNGNVSRPQSGYFGRLRLAGRSSNASQRIDISELILTTPTKPFANPTIWY
jgi:hypothetical protein